MSRVRKATGVRPSSMTRAFTHVGSIMPCDGFIQLQYFSLRPTVKKITNYNLNNKIIKR